MTNQTLRIKRLAVLGPIIAGICWGGCGYFIRGLTDAGLDNPTIVLTRGILGAGLSLIYLLIADRLASSSAGRAKAAQPNRANADRPGYTDQGYTHQDHTDQSQLPPDHKAPVSKLAIRPRDIPAILAVGFFGALLFNFVYNVAVTELSLSLTSVMLSTAPVFVLLISAVVFREKITKKKVVCMVLAFVGCAMLSGILDPGATVHFSKLVLLAGIGTAICNGIYILTSKNVMTKGYGPITVCFYIYLFATIVLIPFADWHTLAQFMAAGPENFIIKGPVGAFIYLLLQSLVSSLLPSIAYMIGMKYVDAGKVAILEAGAEPSAALIVGLLLYSELPTPIGFAGMIISVVSVMVLARE